MTNKGTVKSNAMPPPFGEMGQKNLAACVGMQRDFLKALEEFNHDWSERAAAEVQLVSELASKLSAARTPLDAASAYQEWMTKRMEMLADDGRRLLSGRTLDG